MVDDESNVKQMFQRAAGEQPSADDALARIRPQIRRAHQRRAAVRGGAGLIGMVALGAIVARSSDEGASRLRVAGTGSTVETTTVAEPLPFASSSVAPATAASVSRSEDVSPPPSATAEATTPAPTTPRAVPPTTVGATVPAAPETPSVSASDGASTSESTAVTTASVPPSASSPSSSTSSTSSSTSSTSSTSSSTSLTTAASTASFSSAGGSVSISYTPTAMTLLEVRPAPGFTVGTTNAQPDDIRIQFKRSGEDGPGIHLRLVDGFPQQVHFDE